MSMAIVALEPLPIPLCLGYLAMAARDHACPLVAKKASALVYNRFVNYYGNKSKKKNNAQELQEDDEVMDSDSETDPNAEPVSLLASDSPKKSKATDPFGVDRLDVINPGRAHTLFTSEICKASLSTMYV